MARTTSPRFCTKANTLASLLVNPMSASCFNLISNSLKVLGVSLVATFARAAAAGTATAEAGASSSPKEIKIHFVPPKESGAVAVVATTEVGSKRVGKAFEFVLRVNACPCPCLEAHRAQVLQ